MGQTLAQMFGLPALAHGTSFLAQITSAAAAGLVIGILGGQFVHLVPTPTRRMAPMATSIAPSAPATPAFVQTAAPADDEFLGEIEYAVQLRTPAELRTLAELTLIDDPR